MRAMRRSARDELIERVEERTAKVAVVGQGYVGLPLAMRAVELGFEVVGYDTLPAKATALRDGRSYVEDVSDEELRRALELGYRPTSRLGDLAGFDIAVVAVPTPLRDGLPNLDHIESAGRALARLLRAGSLVVLESTSYPGTTQEFLRPILEESGLLAGSDFFLGYSPERIDPGNETWNFVNTPKVTSGIDEGSSRCVDAFYGALVDKVVPVSSTAEAEMVKLLENTFRHVNIALVNELAMFARDLDVDIWKAIDAASTKPFGYMRFTPGPGVGGHCLPVDPSYLSWRVRRRLGRTFRFVELANDVNEHMPDYVVARIARMLNDRGLAVRGAGVLLLGLAYKRATSDPRESPSMMVAERLRALGAEVRACDPYVAASGALDTDLVLVDFDAENLSSADVVVVLVDHPQFDQALIGDHARLVFDAKAVLRHTSFEGELL
jgi:UDP-N-acetyl-D-glucosamine dehydrogenase